MADRHGHGLIDRKAEEVGRGGRLIIIGGADIGGALHAGGDGGKRKGAVDIDRGPRLQTGGDDIRFSTGHRQVGNGYGGGWR